MHDVVVTGIGPVAAVGIGRAAFHAGLAGAPAAGTAPAFAAEHPVAAVTGLDLATILPSIKTYLDRASELTLAACGLALTDAGLAAGAWARWRAGIVLGSEFGCLGTLHTFTALLQQKGPRLANPLLFSHSYVNTPTSIAAIEFGLGGHHGSFAGHDAGAQALASAVEALQLGRADLLLAVGVDAISEPLYRALAAEGRLDDVLLGEGACALVLETAAHAAARGTAGVPLPAPAAVRPHLGLTFAAEPFFAVAAGLAARR
jgi:3-oxoacyl-[acyl-carrier-protein] synthase II